MIRFAGFERKKRIFITLNLQKSHFFDSFRNSRAARHLPCANTKQPTRCDITPLKKVCSIVDPTTRFRRLYKNISDPGDSEFLGRRNRNQKGDPREEACTELHPKRKSAYKIKFPATYRPYFAIFFRNFKSSNFQNHAKIDVGRFVVASRIERTQNDGFYDFLTSGRPRFGANPRPRPIWTPKSAHNSHTGTRPLG